MINYGKFFLVNLILINLNGYLCISPQPKLIVIAFDGFRYDYLRKTETPNFDFLLGEGVTVPWVKSSFVSNTAPNFQSLVTGLWPENHGVIDNHVWDENFGKYFDYTHEKMYNGYSNDSIPIWIRNEWADESRKSGIIMMPGSVFGFGQNRSIVSHLIPYKLQYDETLKEDILIKTPFTWRVDQGIKWLIDEKYPINLLMIGIEEPDATGHEYGPESPQVVQIIKKLDNLVGYLIERLKEIELFDQVNIIFFSDHGMQEVHLPHGIIDMTNFTQFFKIRAGGESVWFIEPNPGQLEIAYEELKNYTNGNYFGVYKKQDLPQIWHISQNNRTLPLIIVAEPGWVFRGNKNYSKLEKTVGVHGYDNESPYMRTFFLGVGPRFKKGHVGQPFENIDLFPLMCELLEIDQPPNNGSLDRIGNLLFEKNYKI